MNAQPLVSFWVNNNSCNTTPVHTNLPDAAPADGYTIEHDVYSGGTNGTVVEHFKVNNGPHTWLFTPTNDIDYSTEIWKFFMDKSLPVSAVGISEYELRNSVSVFPNPATESFKVLQNEENTVEKIALFDLTGKQITEQAMRGESSVIKVSDYSKGIYILKCFSKEGLTIGCTKLIIE